MAHFRIYAPAAPHMWLLIEGKSEIPMVQEGAYWTVEADVPVGAVYAFRVKDKLLGDPEARLIKQGKCIYTLPSPFDWENVKAPATPKKDLIIYEMHVKGLNKTYLGVIEKIPYLKSLGINAVEIMPVHGTDPRHVTYWGYDPIYFLALQDAYAVEDPISEFKMMVRELHRNGIEVIVDVVYNHTSEIDYTISLKGFAEEAYYLNTKIDYSGCKNTLNTRHHATIDLVMKSLHFFGDELQVDGFRFDLAAILSDELLTRIEKEFPTKKLIAESWDAIGTNLVGQFPKRGPWSEWNDRFRDTVRGFLLGEKRMGDFARVFFGSNHLYTSPLSSINFVTCHDGFSLFDFAHGNVKLMKNCFMALFLSQGIPMMLMGDEYGHTRKGNANPYDQDNEINWFLGIENELTDFVRELIAFRKTLLKDEFYQDHEIEWKNNDWDGRLFSVVIHKTYLITFNMTHDKVTIDHNGFDILINTGEEIGAPFSSLLAKRKDY